MPQCLKNLQALWHLKGLYQRSKYNIYNLCNICLSIVQCRGNYFLNTICMQKNLHFNAPIFLSVCFSNGPCPKNLCYRYIAWKTKAPDGCITYKNTSVWWHSSRSGGFSGDKFSNPLAMEKWRINLPCRTRKVFFLTEFHMQGCKVVYLHIEYCVREYNIQPTQMNFICSFFHSHQMGDWIIQRS